MEPEPSSSIHTLTLTPQPNFPTEDLTELNAQAFSGILEDNAGVIGQSKKVVEYQYPVHDIATKTLRDYDIHVKTNEDTYEAFVFGFSVVDAMIRCLKDEDSNTELVLRRTELAIPKHPFEDIYPDMPLRIAAQAIDKNWPVVEYEHDDVLAQLHLAELRLDVLKRLAFAERHVDWPTPKPNMFRVIAGMREVRQQKTSLARVTLLGAQVSAELQDPSIAA